MVAATRSMEKCHGCSKNVLTHNRIVICSHCQKICHAKCAQKLYDFDHISDSWSCWECSSSVLIRYNPFKSMQYDKYSQTDSDSFEELKQIEHLLDKCEQYNYNQINELSVKLNTAISIFYNNIDGVSSNFDSLSCELSAINEQFSFITLAETNLDSVNKDLFRLNGYQSVYQSKIAGKNKGSGLAIYIRDSFLYTTYDDCCQCTKNLESLFVSVSNTSKPLTVGVIYRPPSGNKSEFIDELKNLLLKVPKSNAIITGDFNIDLHKQNISDFEDIIYGTGFVPLVSIATHFRPGCNPSCIDNIFTNSVDNIIMSGVCENAVSHHLPLFCFTELLCNPCDEINIKLPKYDFSETNMMTFMNSFSNNLVNAGFTSNIEGIASKFSPNEENFGVFVTSLSDTIENSFLCDPKLANSRRNRMINPWITSGIIGSISKKQFLYKKWKKTVHKKKNMVTLLYTLHTKNIVSN